MQLKWYLKVEQYCVLEILSRKRKLGRKNSSHFQIKTFTRSVSAFIASVNNSNFVPGHFISMSFKRHKKAEDDYNMLNLKQTVPKVQEHQFYYHHHRHHVLTNFCKCSYR